MNCFAHALPFLDDPYFVVGTCMPDWMSMHDRKARVREPNAEKFVTSKDEIISKVARGVVKHHQDDHWFHSSRRFNELCMTFSVEIKKLHHNERGMRPGLVGHILVELLLDAYLKLQNPGQMEFMYEQVAKVDADRVEHAINQFASRQTRKVTEAIRTFLIERYLFDYSQDKTLMYRVNRILKSVKLQPFDDRIFSWLPGARSRVYESANLLLDDVRDKFLRQPA